MIVLKMLVINYQRPAPHLECTQLTIGQNDNFTMVATKKYGYINQSVFTVWDG